MRFRDEKYTCTLYKRVYEMVQLYEHAGVIIDEEKTEITVEICEVEGSISSTYVIQYTIRRPSRKTVNKESVIRIRIQCTL